MDGLGLGRREDAVSPVIGVILMVAITVILAAVIATFVLGLGDQVSDASPQAGFTFDYEADSAMFAGFDGALTIKHSTGDSIKAMNLYIVIDGDRRSWADVTALSDDSDVSAGMSVEVPANDDSTVRVVWERPAGDTSATLGEWTGPDA